MACRAAGEGALSERALLLRTAQQTSKLAWFCSCSVVLEQGFRAEVLCFAAGASATPRGVLSAGPSKLPELGKELGKTVKSFQTAAKVRSGIK